VSSRPAILNHRRTRQSPSHTANFTYARDLVRLNRMSDFLAETFGFSRSGRDLVQETHLRCGRFVALETREEERAYAIDLKNRHVLALHKKNRPRDS
jgi:hypothetical protein